MNPKPPETEHLHLLDTGVEAGAVGGGRVGVLAAVLKCTLLMLTSHFYGPRITTIKVDEKAKLRNRYHQIPHPAIVTKWEKNTYNLDGIRTARAEAKRRWPPGYPK